MLKSDFLQRTSLKTRVTFFTLGIFVTSIWLLAFYADRMLRDDIRRVLSEQQYATVSLLAAQVDEAMRERLQALGSLSKRISPSVMGNAAAIQARLDENTILQGLFNGGIFVTDADGTAIADVPVSAGRIGVNYIDRESISIPLRKGESIIGAPAMGKKLQAPIFSIVAPIRDQQGKVIGTIAGTINLGLPNFLDKIANNRYGKTGGYLLITPKDRRVITATDRSRIMEKLPAKGVNPAIDLFLDGYNGVQTLINPAGVEVLAADRGIPVAGWIMASVIPTEEVFSPINDMQRRLLAITALLTLLAGGLTWWMLRRQLLPMSNAMKTLVRWSDTNRSPQYLPVSRHDEIGELISAFNKLLQSLEKKETALIAAKAEAEAANHDKSRFLAAASHDLRQPLSALLLYVGVLSGRATPENAHLVASIQNCCDSLSELLTDLLDVSKLDAGVVASRPADFSVSDFLSSLLTVHSAEAAIKNLRLRLRPSDGIIAYTDQHLLGRIVGNLLANAIRYTHRGGVLIACRRRAGVHWIEIWDTGEGIPADKTKAIFEEFTQLGDDARTRGSGLGLAIVAKTAALLGLEIRLRSRPGRGSMFAIALPPGHTVVPGTPSAQGRKIGQLRIALVENHPETRQALILALKETGHQVIATESGKSLLEQLENCTPDIVISDYRLGEGETGFQVIAKAREVFGTDLPAIIITGDTAPKLIRSMTDRGIAVHFKPLQMDALLAVIRQATARESS